MPNVGRPSRDCHKCRQRRLKCDLKLPGCSQCLRKGLLCPGYPDHLKLRIQVEDISSFQSDINQDRRRSQRQEGQEHDDYTGVVSQGSARFFHRKQIQSHRAPYLSVKDSQVSNYCQAFDHRVVPIRTGHGILARQPDTGVFFGNQIVSESVSFWVDSDKNLSWMARALEMVTAPSRPAWRSTLLAAAILFHGRRLGEEDTQVLYRQYYGKALSYQRVLLKKLCDTSITPTIEDVINTMVLAWTEGMHSTSVSSSKQHLYAASSLLDRIGPKDCQTGCLWGLFRTARLFNMFYSLSDWKPTIFASKRWIEIPFIHNPKTSYDLIIDFLTLLPAICPEPYDRKVKDMSTNAAHGINAPSQDREEILLHLTDRLEGIWNIIIDEFPSIRILPVEKSGANSDIDPLSFGVMILYSLAWLMVLTRVAPQPETIDTLIKNHCEVLLHYARRQESEGPDEALVMTSAALKGVVFLSPSSLQREDAKSMLENWKTRTGFGGLLNSDIMTPEYLVC